MKVALLTIVYLTVCSVQSSIASSLCYNPIDLHYDAAFFPRDKTQVKVNVDSPKNYKIGGVTAVFSCTGIELNSVSLASPSMTSSGLSGVSASDFELDTTDFDGEESKGKWEFTFDLKTAPTASQECQYGLAITICGPEPEKLPPFRCDLSKTSEASGALSATSEKEFTQEIEVRFAGVEGYLIERIEVFLSCDLEPSTASLSDVEVEASNGKLLPKAFIFETDAKTWEATILTDDFEAGKPIDKLNGNWELTIDVANADAGFDILCNWYIVQLACDRGDDESNGMEEGDGTGLSKAKSGHQSKIGNSTGSKSKSDIHSSSKGRSKSDSNSKNQTKSTSKSRSTSKTKSLRKKPKSAKRMGSRLQKSKGSRSKGKGTGAPSVMPSASPSGSLAPSASAAPSQMLSASPSASPSGSFAPSESISPSNSPSVSESPSASSSPSESPSDSPTESPTESAAPSQSPSKGPSESPTESAVPSESPSEGPTESPTESAAPSETPSEGPTESPTESAVPSESPSEGPTESPTESAVPSESPSEGPTESPTESAAPSETPSDGPTDSPTMSAAPSSSVAPSSSTESPTNSAVPSIAPSGSESIMPSAPRSCGAPIVGFALRYTGPNLGGPKFIIVQNGMMKQFFQDLSVEPYISYGYLGDGVIEDLGSNVTVTITNGGPGSSEEIDVSCSQEFTAGEPAPLAGTKGLVSKTWFIESFWEEAKPAPICRDYSGTPEDFQCP